MCSSHPRSTTNHAETLDRLVEEALGSGIKLPSSSPSSSSTSYSTSDQLESLTSSAQLSALMMNFGIFDSVTLAKRRRSSCLLASSIRRESSAEDHQEEDGEASCEMGDPMTELAHPRRTGARRGHPQQQQAQRQNKGQERQGQEASAALVASPVATATKAVRTRVVLTKYEDGPSRSSIALADVSPKQSRAPAA